MIPVSKTGVAITTFSGLFTNQGRLVTDAESAQSTALQVNLRSVAPGEVSSRPGTRRVVFDEDSE